MTPDQHEIVHIGTIAADLEMLSKPVPFSSIRGPDGERQQETAVEQTRRIVETAVMHLIEIGLLVVPDDIAERLEQPIPMERTNK